MGFRSASPLWHQYNWNITEMNPKSSVFFSGVQEETKVFLVFRRNQDSAVLNFSDFGSDLLCNTANRLTLHDSKGQEQGIILISYLSKVLWLLLPPPFCNIKGDLDASVLLFLQAGGSLLSLPFYGWGLNTVWTCWHFWGNRELKLPCLDQWMRPPVKVHHFMQPTLCNDITPPAEHRDFLYNFIRLFIRSMILIFRH